MRDTGSHWVTPIERCFNVQVVPEVGNECSMSVLCDHFHLKFDQIKEIGFKSVFHFSRDSDQLFFFFLTYLQ